MNNSSRDHANTSADDLEESTDFLSPSSTTSTIPPYWHTPKAHQRSSSSVSADSLPVGAITLQDNEENDDNERNNACWAKSVEIVDYIIVNGSATNIGAFVVWIIRVETLTVGAAPIQELSNAPATFKTLTVSRGYV